MVNQHLVALTGRPALIEFFANRHTDGDANRWFDVEKTDIRVNDAGTVSLWLFMADNSLVTVQWLPQRPGGAEAALELARLIAE